MASPADRKKRYLLLALALVAFASPLVESFITGRVEPFGIYGLAETLASLVLLFSWYHLDKEEREYPAGRLMNAGVLVAAVIALPIYFVRTRGWKGGTLAIGLAAAFVGLTFLLGELGEALGGTLRAWR